MLKNRTEIKNSINMLTIRLDTGEERINKLEDKSKENLWTKTETCLENTEKRMRCVEHGFRVAWFV